MEVGSLLPLDLFTIGNKVVVVGKLTNGILKKGMQTTINNKIAKVEAIELYRKMVDQISFDDPRIQNGGIGVMLSGITNSDIDPLIKGQTGIIFQSV